ncbi:hypothetical protein GQR58_006817 [Nymphon striatum]|nr:hypothetical protein GQR58_006817 [Nymphon striatum]
MSLYFVKITPRHAGDSKSQFVNLQPGSLWQVDFHVKENKEAISSDKKEKSLKKAKKKPANPIEIYGANYLKTAEPGFEVLWPKNNYVPDVASTKVFIKSSPQDRIEVFLNGKKISALNYDGSDTNKARTVKISRWLGLDIDTSRRKNVLQVIAKNASGKVIAKETRNIHFSGKPAFAKLLPDESFSDTHSKTISAWLKPALRDWILVGIAEGTLAHKTISGNMQTLEDLGKSDEFYKRGRFAFFAKGQIKGKYLLTAAYDTHKED